MTKIIKWLQEQGIEFTSTVKGRDSYITIILEPNCTWVNGFGEGMKYDKKITIFKNTYNNYTVIEVTGYSMRKQLGFSTKQDTIIQILDERLR